MPDYVQIHNFKHRSTVSQRLTDHKWSVGWQTDRQASRHRHTPRTNTQRRPVQFPHAIMFHTVQYALHPAEVCLSSSVTISGFQFMTSWVFPWLYIMGGEG